MKTAQRWRRGAEPLRCDSAPTSGCCTACCKGWVWGSADGLRHATFSRQHLASRSGVAWRQRRLWCRAGRQCLTRWSHRAALRSLLLTSPSAKKRSRNSRRVLEEEGSVPSSIASGIDPNSTRSARYGSGRRAEPHSLGLSADIRSGRLACATRSRIDDRSQMKTHESMLQGGGRHTRLASAAASCWRFIRRDARGAKDASWA